jgi:hypothetical protein
MESKSYNCSCFDYFDCLTFFIELKLYIVCIYCMNETMSISDNVQAVASVKSLVPDEKIPSSIAEINEVVGKLELKPLKIQDRVCQSPRWRRAASATRWPKN